MRRYCSRIWFTHSVCLSDYGWKAVDLLLWILQRCNSRFVKREVNCVPQSETMSLGRPWCLKTYWRYRWVVPSAVTLVVVGQKCAIFVSRSIQTRMALKPLEGGSSTMKSIDTELHAEGGISKGCSRPCGLWWGVLFRVQVSQDWMYLLMYCHMCGQK